MAVKYNPALDGVRAIAVLMVMCFHAGVPRIAGGFMGVDVFFVLSGYLITSLLMDEYERSGTIRLGFFYQRRFARLTPPLVVMLLVYLLLAGYLWAGMTTASTLRDVFAALFYVSNYTLTFWNFPGHLAHTWSLAVEEQFYLLWPLVILFICRPNRNRHAFKILVATYFAITCWRIGWAVVSEHPYQQAYYRFDTRLTGLILGALVAMFAKRQPHISLPMKPELLGAASIFLLALYSWKFGNTHVVGLTLGIPMAEWISTVLIAICIWSDKQTLAYKLLSNRLPVFVGKMSYGLYLWHFPIFMYMGERYSWQVTFVIGGSLALIFSVVSYYTVEKMARVKIRELKAIPVAN
ncbi:MAG: acyltransferase [Spongiibacteraceae bacterium]